MHFSSLALTAVLLATEATQISAKNIYHPPTRVVNRDESFDKVLRREAFQAFDGEYARRQAANPAASSAAAQAAAANFNTPEWNAQVVSACTSALASIKTAMNPTGMIACYNLPFLNNATGVFEADLRLYQVSAMSGAFTGVQANQLSLSLTYPDATVSQAQQTTAPTAKRSIVKIRQAATASTTAATSTTSGVTELQAFQFIGQVDKSLSLLKLTASQIQSLVIPTIQLSAASPANAKDTISANLTSADTALFVVGVFAGQSASGAVAARPTAIQAAVKAASAFVLPGTTLGIFPIGFIVTMVWTVLFVSAVGYGTYGRMRFREAFRSRVSRARR